MPIPWLAVWQSVPWSEVIRNTPKVAEGARKLWDTVAKRALKPESPMAEGKAGAPVGAKDIEALEARIAALEAAAAELQSQMLASSEVIKALAEQNTQLVGRIEANRVRLVWIAGLAAGLAVALVVGMAWVLRHGA